MNNERKDNTRVAMRDPRVGDEYYADFYTWRSRVIVVTEKTVTWVIANAMEDPVTTTGTRQEFYDEHLTGGRKGYGKNCRPEMQTQWAYLHKRGKE